MATPEGVVRDASDGDDVGADSSSDEDGDESLDAVELAKRAASRHCGWVPSTSNGIEVSKAAVFHRLNVTMIRVTWCRG